MAAAAVAGVLILVSYLLYACSSSSSATKPFNRGRIPRIQKRPQDLRQLPYPPSVYLLQGLCKGHTEAYLEGLWELAGDARYTLQYQELYKRRKETIERVFADAKEKHAMRYTQYRGLAQVTNWVKLKFAAMNLKKLAIWLWREKLFPFISILLCTLYDRNPAYA